MFVVNVQLPFQNRRLAQLMKLRLHTSICSPLVERDHLAVDHRFVQQGGGSRGRSPGRQSGAGSTTVRRRPCRFDRGGPRSRPRRLGRQAPRQRLRARRTLRSVAQDAAQQVRGVRDRRVHAGRANVRRDRDREPRGRSVGLRGTDPRRVHSGEPRVAHGKLRPIEVAKCPFANLPEARSGRWGEGLTAEKLKECVWVRPKLVAEVEFVQWTPDGHLRHARFVGMREG